MMATQHWDDTATYDLTWASSIARRAWRRLRELLAAEGKEQWLDELKPFIAAGSDAPNQDEVTTRLGLPIATLRTCLSRLRQRYRTLLRLEVASTVSNPADVDEELHYLHRILISRAGAEAICPSRLFNWGFVAEGESSRRDGRLFPGALDAHTSKLK